MKSIVGLLLSIAVLLADNANIFDYQNYQGHTDFTDYYGEHHSGEQFNRTKYVLEKLAKENKLDLIKKEFERLKIDYPDDFDNEYVLGKAAANLLEQLPKNTDDIAKIQAKSKMDKLKNEALVLKVKRYFQKNKLSNLIKIKIIVSDDDQNISSEIKHYGYQFEFDYDAKMTKAQKIKLIKLQKKMADCKDEKELKDLRYGLIEYLEDYLVNYAINNKDEYLMKSILFKDVLHGNGCNASYSEYITQNQYIPFYLHYPNIDKYLNQKEAEKAASRIYDMIDLYNQKTGDNADKGIWIKYNSTFIFPDEGKEKEFKFIDFIKMVDKQSPRIAKEVAFYHYDNVLRINGFMNEDETNTTVEK